VKKIDLARLIDHTLLRPEATAADVKRLCREAAEYGFFSAVVNTHWVPLAARELAGTDVVVCSIAGFPLGAVDTGVKAYEAGRAVGGGGPGRAPGV
jgi:deoxyribose-phosphate aldolase